LRRDLSTRVNDPVDLFTPPRAERPWRFVVLHHSAEASGSLASLDDESREQLGTHDCAYHFVIGNGTDSPDGQIEVARRWSQQRTGAHARDSEIPDANEYGIGICLVGDLDQQAPTAKQVESARVLVTYLQERYNIPASHVRTHADLAVNSRSDCPGRLFPKQAIVNDRAFASR
ncbi:MAG TPA: peptidoglycan recognition family protein, partial [Isosphaeraceae bacterium]|nr:peptidoglycan recognition family protein [Isosphaeraceae bacterium]